MTLRLTMLSMVLSLEQSPRNKLLLLPRRRQVRSASDAHRSSRRQLWVCLWKISKRRRRRNQNFVKRRRRQQQKRRGSEWQTEVRQQERPNPRHQKQNNQQRLEKQRMANRGK